MIFWVDGNGDLVLDVEGNLVYDVGILMIGMWLV